MLRVKRGIDMALADEVYQLTAHIFTVGKEIVSFQVCAHCGCEDYHEHNVGLYFRLAGVREVEAMQCNPETFETKPFDPYYCKHLIAVMVYKEMHK